jgi:TonB dependent receptor-like, beta-barrel/TonB-dependent Receptor Plug Domain/CarboxypepD_reg-like domain
MNLKLTTYYLRAVLILMLTSVTTIGYSQTIKGFVYDKQTGEPLEAATVHLTGTSYTSYVELDGSYVLKNVKPGNYNMEVAIIGYKTMNDIPVEVTAGKETKMKSVLMVPDVKALNQVVITGTSDNGSDYSVMNMEKNGGVVQNILSQKTIQLLPDVTVATALQRVSGVSIQRNASGEARYAIIRGMSQRYNNTLVNGIKIPSPDDKYRFVPMDIFPSDMLERLEVIKSLTPDMEGDAIGGTMNLVMKEAPNNFLFTANIAGGYSTLFSDRPFSAFYHSTINKKSPAEIHGNNYAATAADFPLNNLHYYNKSAPVNSTMGFTIGDRFLHQRLGVIVAVTYQNFFRGSNSDYLIPSAQPYPTATGNIPEFTDSYARQYSTQTNRLGINNKIDFVINPDNKISLYNLYVHQNDFETRFTPDTTIGTNSSEQSKDVDIQYRSMWHIQSIYNSTLQGIHQLSNKVKLDWSAVYSLATNQVPDMAWFDYNSNISSNTSGQITQVNNTTYGTGMERVWEHNTDQDLAGYLNLTYTPRLFGRAGEFKAGGLYRYKTRNNYYNDYSLLPTYSTPQPYTTLDSIPFYFSPAANGTGAITATNPNTYTLHEKIAAGYVETKFMLSDKLQVLGGVRVENTHEDYQTVMPASFNQRSGTIYYTDVLPDVHFKYSLTSNENLRLSYFKSISRPGFGEIDPYHLYGEYFDEIGNPELKHTRADNLDLRYEWFPNTTDQLLLGVFYKNLQNPIEYFVTTNGGPSAQFIQPENVNRAINYGFEAVYTHYFGMFGVSANYTYTHSQVTTSKLLYIYVPNVGDQTKLTQQTRPLQGQADNIGNLSLLYKNPKLGLNMQVALAYTGTRIAQVSEYYGLDIWQKAYTSLDFSIEKSITKHFYFYAKVNNITNAPNELYIKAPPDEINKEGYTLPYQAMTNETIVERDIYNTTFLLGIRCKF